MLERKAAAAASALAVTVALTTAGAVAPPDVAAPELPSGIEDSRSLDTPLLSSGTLRTTTGAAVGDGTPVVLYAWPDDEALASAAIGEALPLTPVAATTTTAGRFELRLPNSDALAPFSSGDGIADLEIMTSADAQPVSSSFSVKRSVRKILAGGVRPGLPVVNGGTTPEGTSGMVEVAEIEPTVETNGISLSPDGTVPLEETAEMDADSAAATTAPISTVASSEATPASSCSVARYKEVGNRWAIVGEGYNSTGVTNQFSYNEGRETTLGTAISATSKAGGWKASGTKTLKSDVEVDFPASTYFASKNVYKTGFFMAIYKTTCWSLHNPNPISVSYSLRPWAGAGGTAVSSSTNVPTGPLKYCINQVAGSSYGRASEKAATFGGGLAVGDAIGMTLSSQAGYNTRVKIRYQFNKAARICGTNGPANVAARLYTRAGTS
ncbi:hypothetical protein KIN34_15395 [Cellulomonas sp. DKR-3]|uniref:Uncharacterized protein n=1 Tax=Cellulomonas fulva TaxID=2835530 RepID=A0ABS5U2P3_9CELL|nr:hypothetical protein [Cellulomonas fulva]MBT0995664.1 hypothetical protein [Cellulomonas fulva]